jgi:hypothetical protein
MMVKRPVVQLIEPPKLVFRGIAGKSAGFGIG